MGSPEKTRQANEYKPNYMPHPKDVRIAELQAIIQQHGIISGEKQ
ncbi:hypothetical protein NQ848_17295 [Acinetobacter baumannii]|nr:hypothetical protein [Acinetobacter baumannii]